MSRKKNTLSLNISKNKNWNNSWSSYLQEEYHFLLQEDIILQSYFRSQLKDLEKINIINLRFYRVNKLLLVDIGVSAIKFLNKKMLLKLTSFLTYLAKFFDIPTQTIIYSDCQNRFLTKGEVAIIVADRLKTMPYYNLTGIQNCTLSHCENNSNLIEYYF